eukprot:13545179-Alexandrium_andersonii.AAC.1
MCAALARQDARRDSSSQQHSPCPLQRKRVLVRDRVASCRTCSSCPACARTPSWAASSSAT